MIQFSHDVEAGTLYCYFTELVMGQIGYELEYPVALLLDAHEAVIGLRLILDDEITLDQLELALEHECVTLEMDTGSLRVNITNDPPSSELDLADVALLDCDKDGIILGVDLAVPAAYRTPQALARLNPFLVEIEELPDMVMVLPEAQNTPTYSDPAAAERAAAQPQLPPPTLNTPALRSGYVALVGKPNVGKSTLLNTLLGQKVAIVSPRPQTTRVPLRGILNRPDAQVVFVDTPGIHTPRHKLGAFMVDLARRAIPAADLICFMVDISMPPSQLDERIAAQVLRARSPHILVLNKVDLKVHGPNHLEQYQALGPWDMEVAISARTGAGLDTLVEEIVRRLPHGPRFYPDDQLSDQTERQFAAELVREKALLFTDQEVPHSVAVAVDEWNDKEHATYIRMTINVEKESQKSILIGMRGMMLKRIGTEARKDIEVALGRQVFLELWVKARPNWRNDPSALGWLGYTPRDWK